MAQFGMSVLGTPGFESAPPNDFIAPVTTPIEAEDSEEWEYEYSNTETETYYLTLDLTTPEIDPKRKPTKKGVVKTKWVNANLSRNKRSGNIKPATYSTVIGERDVDNDLGKEEDAEQEDVDEDGPANDESSKNYATLPTQIQILDLHSVNPMVSYDGHVYSCQWASNVGTELLFTAHDRESPFPALRTLPGGVDLLAASSARLISTYVEVEAKQREHSPGRAFKRGSHMGLRELVIPMTKAATAERKDQAAFLGRLMEIKEQRGETDQVTVNAYKRLTNPQWRRHWRRTREDERQSLEAVIKRFSSGKRFDEAMARLNEMEEEDKKAAQGDAEKGLPVGGKKWKGVGRKRKELEDAGKVAKEFKPRKRLRRDNVKHPNHQLVNDKTETMLPPTDGRIPGPATGNEEYEQRSDEHEDAPEEDDDNNLILEDE